MTSADWQTLAQDLQTALHLAKRHPSPSRSRMTLRKACRRSTSRWRHRPPTAARARARWMRLLDEGARADVHDRPRGPRELQRRQCHDGLARVHARCPTLPWLLVSGAAVSALLEGAIAHGTGTRRADKRPFHPRRRDLAPRLVLLDFSQVSDQNANLLQQVLVLCSPATGCTSHEHHGRGVPARDSLRRRLPADRSRHQGGRGA
jgi:hypothetical protein